MKVHNSNLLIMTFICWITGGRKLDESSRRSVSGSVGDSPYRSIRRVRGVFETVDARAFLITILYGRDCAIPLVNYFIDLGRKSAVVYLCLWLQDRFGFLSDCAHAAG